VGEATVPGIHWLPADAPGPHPTVCIGHGGFQHKRIDNVLELARQLVAHLGVGVVALDAPEHGDRITDPDGAARALAAVSGGDPAERRRYLGARARAAMAERAEGHVAEWRALLDHLQTDPRWAAGPFGWWGVSMGTTHGLPLAARDARIAAAVFGLNALRPGDDDWARQAAAVTIPVLFLNQWDDELMTREASVALWEALGSREKTMHVNPGRHVQVPRFERDASEDFFRRHLLPPPT
jgi:dienelactone hydrolase